MAPLNPPPQTIKSLKQDFLNAQTRLLSQPPAPSRAWRRAHDNSNNEDNANPQKLSEKAIDDALFRLNQTLQQHAKRVYPPQATRHVAEQIEQLYLDAGEERMQTEREDGEGEGGAGDNVAGWGVGSLGGGGGNAWRMQGADYAQPEIISALPSTWDSPREAATNPLEAKRYADLVERLQASSTRHSEAEARVRRLRHMKAVLEPFSSSTSSNPTSSNEQQQTYDNDDGKFIQQNLITRDGQVEKELERMRMLLARVGDKVARLQGKEGGRTRGMEEVGEDAMIIDDVEVDERRKVDSLLSGLT